MSTRFGFVSTFPPTQCGLATFTAALRDALLRSTTDEGWVVRLVEAPASRPGDEVVAQLVANDSASIDWAAAQLNRCDVAIMQHEYGIYGGADGSEILHLLDQVRVPRVVVLHTVLTDPTAHQRQILESVIAKADAIVAMTMAARERLAAGYAVDMAKVSIIAHGAPVLETAVAEPTFRTGQFTVLTWGLLGPGKGIEWGIEAMAMLRDLAPMPWYTVAGQTHPKVLLHEGDAYRDRLHEQVRQADLGSMVTFDDYYRNTSALASLVRPLTWFCCPTTRPSRSPRACSSRRWRPASRWWRRSSRTPERCWRGEWACSCRTAIRPRSRRRSARSACAGT
jgi:glycosyltransferase involved in cell wall biosynthesis